MKPGYIVTLLLVFTLLLLPAGYTILNKMGVGAAANAFSFWHFDEGVDNTCSGGTNDVCDGMTGANDLAKTNAVWQTEDQCISGKCIFFDGSGDFLSTVTDNNDFDFAGADSFSISGWFRHPTIATNPDYLIAKHNATAGGYKIYMNSDGTLTFGIDADSTWSPTDAATSTQRFDDNIWHHFTAVKNGTTDITLYVDGQQVGQDTSITSSTLANGDIMYVGIDGNGSSNGWEGYLDEVKYYNYVRTSTLVKTDVAAGVAAKGTSATLGKQADSFATDGLTGYWKLDETSGNAVDSSGNSLTLTNNSTTTFVDGKFGNGSEHVPASTQYFSTATTISGVQTVSFWTNPDSTTNYYVSLTSGAYITSSSGTLSATGFTNPKIYVNGVESTTIAQDAWQFVTVTTDTAISANQFYIGRQGSNYYDGTIDDVRLYKRQISPNEINNLFYWTPRPNAYYNFDDNTTLTPSATPSGAGMVVYSDLAGNDDLVYYRIMQANGSWQAAAATVTDVDGGSTNRIPQLMELYSSRTRNEKILLSSHADGTNFFLYATVYNGETGTWNTPTLLDQQTTTQFNAADPYFDGGYLNSGDFMAAYSDNTATPKYQIWNGSSWTGSDLSMQSVGNQPYELVLRVRPGTNEVMVVTFNINNESDANYYDGAGTAASDWTLTSNISTASENGQQYYVDFAWSTNNPLRGLLVYVDSASDFTPNVNIFTANGSGGGSWGTSNEAVDIGDEPGAPQVVDRPGTNEFIFCVKGSDTTAPDIDCLEENDNDTTPTVKTTTTGDITSSTNPDNTAQRPFSVGYEQTSAATAIIVYADTGSAGVPQLKKYDPTTGTNGTWDAAATTLTTLTESLESVEIEPAPGSDDMAILMRDSGEDITIAFWDGTNNAVYAAGDRTQTQLSAASGYTALDQTMSADFSWDLIGLDGTTTSFDRSTNANNGTLSGTISTGGFAPGKYGTAGTFDGFNDFVSVADNANLDFTGSFTISAWIKHPTIATNPDYLITKYTGSAGGYKVYMENDGDITCAIDDDTASFPEDTATSTAATYDDDAWHHIACVREGTANLKLYIDGVLILSDPLSATGSLANANTFYMGVDGDGASNPWEGEIDDVRLYNYARNAGQIMEDMNGGHPLGGSPVGSQVAYWKLDENTGTTVNNSATGTYTTSITGALWNQQQRSGVPGCKLNNCLNFDGSDDVLTVTNTTAIDGDLGLNAGFTFSAWINPDTVGEGSAGEIFNKNISTYCRLGGSTPFNISCSVNTATTDPTLTVNAQVPASTWTHIALGWTDDADDELTIYINGTAVGTSTNGVGSLATDAANLLIGGGTSNNFDGRIDDFKVYSAQLSNEEIMIDRNANAAINLETGTTEENGLHGGTAAGPVGWWKFDDNTGTTAIDASGNGNSLTLVNTASTDWVNGYNGSAFNVDATNNIAYLNGSSSTLEPSVLTVSAWVKLNAIGTCNGGALCYVVADEPIGATSNGRGYLLWVSSGGLPAFSIGDGTAYRTVSGATTLSANVWYHITGTYDLSNLRVYVNGVLDGTQANTSAITYTNGAGGPTAKTFYVGSIHDNDATSNTTTSDMIFFNGQIDEVKVYNYVRSQPQIALDATRGKPTGWWKFDECTGTTLNDSSPQGKITNKTGTWTGVTLGTNTSAGTCSTSGAWFNGATGKRNYSLDFDGTDDVVTVSNASPIDIDTNLNRGFTIAAWINPATAGEGTGGQVFNKSTNNWLRVDTLSGGRLDVEANVDLATTDANLNVSSAVATGAWSHVAMVYDSSALTVSIYVNGQLRGTSSAGSGALSADSSSLLIGGGTSNNFDGLIDDFKIYNFAMLETQVRKSMNDESGVTFEPSTGAP